MFCPNCGKENKPSAKFCWSCGTNIQGAIPSQQVVVPTQTANDTCPVCKLNDKVEKVSGIVQRDSVTETGTRREYDEFDRNWKDMPFSSSRKTELAEKLSAPPKPKPSFSRLWYFLPLSMWIAYFVVWFSPIPRRAKWFILAMIGGMFAAAGVVAIVGMLTRASPGQQITPIQLAVVISVITCFWAPVLLSLVVYEVALWRESKRRHAEYESKILPRWEQQMRIWDGLYYCRRDDIVFDPTTQKTASPNNIKDLYL